MSQQRVQERVPVKVERKLEREWNVNGMRTERKWNAFFERVPDAFPVRLSLLHNNLIQTHNRESLL